MKDRRSSNFKPLDPCLGSLYVKLKPGEEITVKASDFLPGLLIFRDRRLANEFEDSGEPQPQRKIGYFIRANEI